jgi:hypothetical protein
MKLKLELSKRELDALKDARDVLISDADSMTGYPHDKPNERRYRKSAEIIMNLIRLAEGNQL